MMISPMGFIEMHKEKRYEDLIKVRDELIDDLRSFEANPDQTGFINPSPEVVYQMNLQYLGKLCELIAEKYNQEYVWGEEEE